MCGIEEGKGFSPFFNAMLMGKKDILIKMSSLLTDIQHKMPTRPTPSTNKNICRGNVHEKILNKNRNIKKEEKRKRCSWYF